jgi:cytoplasmic iron level regulating protein YaaA (DUF328/UPF0246 family)
MLVLLPPSEGKTAPKAGDALDLGSLAFAEALTERRLELLEALERLGRAAREEAVAALAISPGQAGEVEVDAKLRRAPAAPAASVYSGVLYERLDLRDLPAAAQRRVLIASALWGAVRPGDRIPYYRLSAKAKLPGVGALTAWWRPALAEALPDEEGELVVDMRSGAYAAAWKPRRSTLLAVRAFREEAGVRKAVSHMAKAVRGEVARALLAAKEPPADPETAAAVAESAGFSVDLGDGSLDVILRG